MGKHGPCCHCGVTSTPLWRNGPPEKPVLCNACGSRWRTKGSLVNYTPLHSRAEPDDFEDYRVTKVKKVSIKPKEVNAFKRKFDNGISEYGVVPPDYNTGFIKGFEENTSNRSSSGSAISNSESCANADASDLTGPSQPNAWNKIVPSRKRTCVTRPNPKPSPVEKLTKDLYTIWHEQQSSCLSGSSEGDVLLETENSMASLGFGYGSVLIRSVARDEESEASSLPIYQKQNIVNSRPMAFKEDSGVNLLSRGTGKINKPPNQGSEIHRDKDQLEKLQILGHHNSPLCHIDLQDVLNFDELASLLTNNEQQQLLKFLPSVDTVEAPFGLKSMFDSAQFKENLLSFQKLLAEGVFDSSLAGVSIDDCRILKKLILGNLKKSKWVEQYNIFKDFKGKNIVDEPKVAGTLKAIAATDHSATTKRSQDGPYKKLQGAKVRMMSPTRIIMKSSYNQKELIDNDETFLGAKRVFSTHFGEDSCDQDLLLDVPSNSSFPQAELLLSTSSFGAQASASSVVQYT